MVSTTRSATRKARSTARKARSGERREARRAKRWVDRLQERLPPRVEKVVAMVRGQDILLFASGLSFYGLVSIVPLAIFVIWAASLIVGDARIHSFANELRRAAPKHLNVGGFVERVASLGTSLGATALITALWPASSYGSGLRRAFDRLGPKPAKQLKGLRGRALALLVLLPIFVLGSLLGSYAGTAVLGDGVAFKILGIVLALVIGFAGTAIGVALIYRIFPPERMPWKQILKGTVWSASTISVLSLGFTVFANTAHFEEHYGTAGVAAIVLIGVWLFLSNALLLVGYRIALDA